MGSNAFKKLSKLNAPDRDSSSLLKRASNCSHDNSSFNDWRTPSEKRARDNLSENVTLSTYILQSSTRLRSTIAWYVPMRRVSCTLKLRENQPQAVLHAGRIEVNSG